MREWLDLFTDIKMCGIYDDCTAYENRERQMRSHSYTVLVLLDFPEHIPEIFLKW